MAGENYLDADVDAAAEAAAGAAVDELAGDCAGVAGAGLAGRYSGPRWPHADNRYAAVAPTMTMRDK